MRKKPEPEVKPTEIGPPKAAIAGVVGVAAALVLGLLRRLRNAGKSGGGGRDNEWKTLAADAKDKVEAHLGGDLYHVIMEKIIKKGDEYPTKVSH